MKTFLLWVRWTRRDLRQRWVQVLVIAIIIALGTGIYSGLISTSAWRTYANDTSYAMLNMYDLRVSLTTGSYLNHDQLLSAIDAVEHREWVTGVEPRLILPTLVDASTDDQVIMVPGRIIGSSVSTDQTPINDVYVMAGRSLTDADQGQPAGILEYKFARYYGLPGQGTLYLSGGKQLEYVGTGLAPEYFMVFTDEGGMMAEANFAAIFVSLETAQGLGEHPNMVNDVLLTLTDDADYALIRSEIEQSIQTVARVGVSFMERKDDQAYNMLYEDVKHDEVFWRWMAYIFLLGAVFGAFNLATRLVESQRREIGIQMALGVSTFRIAIRPLLVAFQIALLGTFFGVIMGVFIGNAFGQVIVEMLPTPVFEMPFQPRVFLEAALLGVILPVIAALIPVIRAVRVEPVDAIKTGHLVAKGGGLVPVLSRVFSKGGILARMPFYDLLLAPRRTFLTLLGIAAAITVLVVVMGTLDSFDLTLAQARTELLQNSPDRLVIQLNFFYATQSPVVNAIQESETVGDANAYLRLGGVLKHGDASFETLIQLFDMQNSVWHPSIQSGDYPADIPAILISENAARDLGVRVGDSVTLRHPRRTGLFSYDWVETSVIVSGIHPLPMRFQTYIDIRHASVMRLEGIVNTIQVNPAAGFTQDQVKRDLFNQDGVTSIQPVSALIRVFEELIGEFAAIFVMIQAGAVILAVLIAYNSTSINLDERAREMATMFAFGVRIRTALRVAITENLIVNGFGIVVGCIVGFVVLSIMITVIMTSALPDIEVKITLHVMTVVVALLVGGMAAILTPLLNARRFSRMDVPSTLRVLE